MQQLTPIEIANWIALYAATFECSLIALVLSVGVLIYDLVSEGPLEEGARLRPLQFVSLVPRVWWRWQKLYLLSTPVTLSIVAYFAATLRWH